jgi:hypothetical protein
VTAENPGALRQTPIDKETIMSDTKKTPSTADYIGAWAGAWAACAAILFPVSTVVHHLFGYPWRVAAIRGAILAVVITTVFIGVRVWTRKSGSTRP